MSGLSGWLYGADMSLVGVLWFGNEFEVCARCDEIHTRSFLRQYEMALDLIAPITRKQLLIDSVHPDSALIY